MEEAAANGSDRLVYEREPLNAGPPLDRLTDRLVTPTELVYIRNHGRIPELDDGSSRVRVDGLVDEPLDLSPSDLAERFERTELVAALCCAGNRRRELMDVDDIPGETPWGPNAISNVAWSGWRLRDVLAAAGPSPAAAHVAFTGRDRIESGRAYFGGSIPLAKATGPEVLLADRMNDAPLPPAHGFPLRVVVPGWIGARSVKWLTRIEVRSEPSTHHHQQRAYRLFPRDAESGTMRWDQGMTLGELAVNAAIGRPRDGERVTAGVVPVRGWALSGGARRIERVELTLDEGRTWTQAGRLERSGPWGWTRWHAELTLPPGDHEVAVRAFDEAANTQPERPDHLWNLKGYANNAWHRIRLRAE